MSKADPVSNISMSKKTKGAALAHPALVLFDALLVPSPSGYEGSLAEIVRRRLGDMGYDPETDDAGNILVRVPSSQIETPAWCMAAHMDEIGMVVTSIGADGVLRVDRSGGLYPWKLGEGPVELLGDHQSVTGILSMGSTHTAEAGDQRITWDQVHILTGLSVEQLENAGVRPGTPAVPTRERRGPVIFGDPEDPLVAAWTFDDRMGVVTLLRLLEVMKNENIQPRQPLIVAFTVPEERGGNGAKVLAHRERPACFIAVDGAPIPPGSPLQLDGRPGVWSKDRLANYDPLLLQSLQEAARRAGTNLQYAVYKNAASDASLVYYSGGAPRVACVGHVRENSHGFEVARLSVFDNLLDTLVQFIRT